MHLAKLEAKFQYSEITLFALILKVGKIKCSQNIEIWPLNRQNRHVKSVSGIMKFCPVL